MRELAVFYCPKCGYYAYYQTTRHACCPKCQAPDPMPMARMHYTEFMQMSCQQRDDYLSAEILRSNPSLIARLTWPHKRYNSRELIAELNCVVMSLDTENKILSDTVKWMHDTIWELLREKRGLEKDQTAQAQINQLLEEGGGPASLEAAASLEASDPVIPSDAVPAPVPDAAPAPPQTPDPSH